MKLEIRTKLEYEELLRKLESLAMSIQEEEAENPDNPAYIEMKALANLIVRYEEVHHPIAKPLELSTYEDINCDSLDT